jgi:hypothetical protein
MLFSGLVTRPKEGVNYGDFDRAWFPDQATQPPERASRFERR